MRAIVSFLGNLTMSRFCSPFLFVAYGFRHGLRFLSLMMLTLGLTVALLLWRTARGLHAPPGAGYT